VLVELEDGTLVNVEMQCDPRGASPKRWLYHWGSIFSDQLERGDEYERLEPVVCIAFLAHRSPEPERRFHAVYRVLEVHDGTTLSDALEIHLIELPRLERTVSRGATRRSSVGLGTFAARTPVS
jgi:predicted transposase/invertase (TIGR01784 family)